MAAPGKTACSIGPGPRAGKRKSAGATRNGLKRKAGGSPATDGRRMRAAETAAGANSLTDTVSELLPMRRLAFSICLAASLIALPTFVSAQSPKPSAAKENAEGDPSGAIRALGAAGYNDHAGRKPPPVTIPPLNMGRSERGGVPHGTAGGPRRR